MAAVSTQNKLRIVCPLCDHTVVGNQAHVGKKVRCTRCKEVFTVPASKPVSSADSLMATPKPLDPWDALPSVDSLGTTPSYQKSSVMAAWSTVRISAPWLEKLVWMLPILVLNLVFLMGVITNAGFMLPGLAAASVVSLSLCGMLLLPRLNLAKRILDSFVGAARLMGFVANHLAQCAGAMGTGAVILLILKVVSKASNRAADNEGLNFGNIDFSSFNFSSIITIVGTLIFFLGAVGLAMFVWHWIGTVRITCILHSMILLGLCVFSLTTQKSQRYDGHPGFGSDHWKHDRPFPSKTPDFPRLRSGKN